MRKLIVILIITSMFLPSVIGYGNDGMEPIWGLDFVPDDAFMVDDWSVIGNRTLASHTGMKAKQARLKCTTNIPYNITHAKVTFSAEYNERSYAHGNITTSFEINNGINNTHLYYEKYYKKGLLDTTFKIKIYIDEPATTGLYELFIYTHTTELGFSSIEDVTLNTVWLGGNQYAIQVLLATRNLELEANDLQFPSHFKLLEETRGLMKFIRKLRLYQIYYITITDTNNLWINPTAFYYYAYKHDDFSLGTVYTHASAGEKFSQPDEMFSNNTYTPLGLVGVSESFNAVGRLFKAVGNAFYAIRFGIVGDIFFNVADNAHTASEAFMGMIPIVLSLYGLFLLAVIMKGLFTTDLGYIWNHFVGLFMFFFGLIKTVVSLFWSFIGTLSNIPVVGWIVSVGVVAGLIFFGVNVMV